jgi:cytoskeletal protein CcmA (bactofilin family)
MGQIKARFASTAGEMSFSFMTKAEVQSKFDLTHRGIFADMFFKRSRKGNGQAEPPPPPSDATFIARDMKIEGNLVCNGELHIDGQIVGSVRAQVCLVDANASVTGDISADTVYIYGEVVGPVDATNVHIYASARVRGDVSNESISIENGASIQGSIRNGRQPTLGASYTTSPFSNATLFGNLDQNYKDDYQDYRPVKVVTPRG